MLSLLCPVCGLPMIQSEKAYACENGHSFDRAKSGYVNLLPPQSAAKHRGDDKRMVAARTAFLNKGYYTPLRDAVTGLLAARLPAGAAVIDAGCGEGYYTAAVAALPESADVVGIDISKEALIAAGRRSRSLTLCAASTARMPLASGCADALLNIFSPLMTEEFARVLKPGGLLLRAVPLEDHLWELKQLIYDTPYRNPAPEETLPGFRLIGRQDVCYPIDLPCGEDIMALFQMTPYYYKTGAADQQKAANAGCLHCRLSFGVLLYEKV